LNAHPLNRAAAVRIHADDARKLDLTDGGQARVADAWLPVVIDPAVPAGAVWIEAGQDFTATLPPYGAAISLSKA
jgi:NADH-quinone oxidoreductase subunit G